MSRNRYKNAKDKRDGETHIGLPHCVLNGSAYLSLNSHARMLLLDLAAQYRGDNNGDLCAAWKVMHPRGWKSEATLNKAKQDLIASELVVETRKGARPNKCSLFALTFYALDDCGGKLDITAKSFPRGAYLLKDRPPVIISRNGEKRIA
ncbi:MAG: hypothetical protein WAO71_15295 [Gallionella sp.]